MDSAAENSLLALVVILMGLIMLERAGSVRGQHPDHVFDTDTHSGHIHRHVLGALLFEPSRLRELRRAFQASRSAFRIYLVNYIVQLVISFAIFAVFVGSLWITGGRT